MTVSLVTGAGGFVGNHLCRHLISRGVPLRRISSSAADCGTLATRLLEPDRDRLVDVLRGVSTVYFLAGIAHEAVAAGDADLLWQVNVEAPVRWLRAADRAGVERFVWLSSIKVLGDRSADPLEPDDPYRPGDAYARSKVAAEERLLAAPLAATSLAIVRPPLVYGSGVRGNFRKLLELADTPLPLPLSQARAPRSFVAADNLCDLLVRLGAGGDGIFHVADREDLTVADLLTRLRRLLGRPARLLPMPASLARGAASLANRRAVYERLFEPLQVDASATRDRLGWSPPVDADDALAATVTWFRTSR